MWWALSNKGCLFVDHVHVHVIESLCCMRVVIEQTNVHSRGQAVTFDQLEIPWVYDPNVGPLVAERVDGSGDGMYRYTADDEGRIVVQRNPEPTAESVFHALRVACFERVCASVDAQYAEDALARERRGVESGDDSSEGVVEEVEGAKEDVRGVDEPAVRGSKCVKRRRRSAMDALLDDCTIHTSTRTNGRIDLTIETPDGRKHRSKVQALLHLGRAT